MSVRARIAFFYVAVFLVLGLHLPYWPVWLRAEGLDERQIGWLIATGLFVRVLTVPLIGALADRLGMRRGLMIALSGIALLGFCLFSLVSGFGALAVVTVLTMMAYPSLMPMIETMTVQLSRQGVLDFGRTRIWGSAAFVAANVAGGMLLDRLGAPMILTGILVFLSLTLAAALVLPPDPPRLRTQGPNRAGADALLRVARAPLFWLFALSAGLIQGAHGMYYGFASIHWRSLGHSGDAIGMLWAIGVIAEIILFFYAGRILTRMSPVLFILIGGAGAVLRWALIAVDPPLAGLVIAQLFHALSFGAVHIGALHLIDRAVPDDCAMTAQTTYSAMAAGVIVAGVTLVSGDLYAVFQGQAFFAMAALSALGSAGLLVLRAVWRTGMLIPQRS